MAQITEDYVSYKIAKLLKEKGFNENTPVNYFVGDDKPRGCAVGEMIYHKRLEEDTHLIACPTLQMAMKWLREVHHLHISVEMGFDVDNSQYFFFVPSICKFSNKDGEYLTPFGEREFNIYEEAAGAAIKYCLEKLI